MKQRNPTLGLLRRVFVAMAVPLSIYVFCGLLLCQPLSANSGEFNSVKLRTLVTLHSADSSRSTVVEDRQWDVPLDRRFSAFLANFSLELIVKRLDSQRVEVNAFLATVGARPDSRTKRFTMEFDLPATINHVRGKSGAFYRLQIIPQEYSFIDFGECDYSLDDTAKFKFDPTANFDLYYAPRTLGDYHWNKVKELLETGYRPYRKGFDMTMSGKMHYYLYPCASPTVGWDNRFGYALDPTRAKVSVVYTHDFMSASPMTAILNQTLRVSGYAPPFLAEGIAGYFSFFDLDVRRAVAGDSLIPLSSLLTTQEYYNASPLLATAEAGSFCRYLADTHGIGLFRQLYAESDDLNIADKLPEIYGVDLETLQIQWLEYLQTLKPSKKQFLDRSRIEGAYNNLPMAISVMLEAQHTDTTLYDTLVSLRELATLYSQTGDYDLAANAYQRIYDSGPANDARRPYFLLRVAYMSLLNGDLTRSREVFQTLQKLDTVGSGAAEFNLAMIDALEGDTASAITAFEALLDKIPDPLLQVEASLFLGFMLASPGEYADPQRAQEHFDLAYSIASHHATSAPRDPLHRFRVGLAALGQGEYELAQQNLAIALFLEFRPRYLGRELTALGNLADLLGNRQEALEYYNRADSLDHSYPGQQTVSQYLKEPFTLLRP